jgi:Tfp pilus assembly protein PilO
MKKEQQTYIAIGIGVLFFLFIYFKFFLVPINNSISDKRNKIETLENDISIAKKESAGLEELKVRSVLLQQEVADLQKKLPKSKEIPGFLRIVTRNAQRFGVKLQNISQPTMAVQQEYNELKYNFSFTSSFHSLGNFFAEIGQEERLLSIRDLTLSAQAGTDKSVTVSGTFSLIAFMAKSQ